MFSFSPALPVPACFRPCLWLDATNPHNNQIIPGNSTLLASWADKSGNSNTVSAGTQGTFTTNAVNGHPGVTFSGTQSYSGTDTNFPTGSHGRSNFVVFQSGSSLPAQGFLFNYGTTTGAEEYGQSILSTGALRLSFGPVGNSSTNGTPIAINTAYIYSDSYTSGSNPATGLTMFLGNSAQASTNTTNIPNTILSGTQTIGTRGALAFIGSIGEILCFNYQLSATQQLTVYNYLHAKWGI